MKAIDLFSGAGGFTQGATRAGVNVVWAANHWDAAVQTHAHNHPEAMHICQDLHQADWSQVPAHDLLLASPCCQGHSKARGKERPQHDESRSTAWAIVSCAEFHRPEFAVIENVREFLDWALYPSWADAMNRLGYMLSPMVIDAANHEVPQNRVRVFIIASRSKSPLLLQLRSMEHKAIEGYINWDADKWSQIDKPGRAVKTLSRIESGRKRYGERFVMPYYGSGSGLTGRGLDKPLGTVSTRDRWAIVDGKRMRMFSVPELTQVMGFPKDYKLPVHHRTAVHMLGNAVCPPVVTDILTELKRVA